MKKKILYSFVIVTLFSVLDRALGFFLKIYMSRVLGSEGMGVYQMAFSVYSVMLALVTGGIPLVCSKLTARYANEKDKQHKIASSALLLSFSISVLLVSLFLACYKISGLLLSYEVRFAVTLMLPALVFSSVYSSLRGSMWGKEKFFLVSVVEVIEQLARIGACTALVLLGFDKLGSVALALSIGSIASSASTLVFYLTSKGRFSSPLPELIPLASSAMPISLSHVVGALSSSVTSLLVPKLFILSGYSQSTAHAMLGASLGMAVPLLHIPITIVSSLAFLLIPKIGSLSGKNDNEAINQTVQTAIKFAVFVACCFIPLFSSLGKNLCELVYGDETSGYFLQLISLSLVPLSLESITVAIMNSLDMEMRSFFNGVIGYSFIWIVALLNARSFSLSTLAFAFTLSWGVTALLHIKSIKKRTGLSLSFVKPCLIIITLTYPTTLFTRNVSSILGFLPNGILLPVCFILSCLIFVCLSISFGTIKLKIVKNTIKKRKVHG